MLPRILLTLALIAFAIWWLRRKFGGSAGPVAARRKPGRADERILPCAHCGVHIPESEGILEKGRFFCSREHQLHGPDDETNP